MAVELDEFCETIEKRTESPEAEALEAERVAFIKKEMERKHFSGDGCIEGEQLELKTCKSCYQTIQTCICPKTKMVTTEIVGSTLVDFKVGPVESIGEVTETRKLTNIVSKPLDAIGNALEALDK
jgi:hypothetical protein